MAGRRKRSPYRVWVAPRGDHIKVATVHDVALETLTVSETLQLQDQLDAALRIVTRRQLEATR